MKHPAVNKYSTGCSLNIVFFPRILESLPPLPHQPSAAIGCTKKYQPIGVTVHSRCVDSFEGLLQRCFRGRGCSELWKKAQFFPKHPIPCLMVHFQRNKLLPLSHEIKNSSLDIISGFFFQSMTIFQARRKMDIQEIDILMIIPFQGEWFKFTSFTGCS